MDIDLQSFIFEQDLSRRELFGYKTRQPKTKKIQIFRNHAFELVEHTIGAYLDYAELGVEFIYGGYDDSFSFHELYNASDMVIIWVDAKRYDEKSVKSFIAERAEYLKSIYTKPILIIPFGKKIDFDLSGVYIYNLDKIKTELGDHFTDERASAATGTSLSSKALLRISQELGLKYIPALIRPAVKAVVVDFDNTIYRGVLGEDGIDGIILTEGHRKFQNKLKALSECGIFICAVSKNDNSDVEEMFKKRSDFPLKKTDFTNILVSWNSKADSIKHIAEYLNIGVDAMVFVDDNIGELASVNAAFPQIKIIHALDTAEKTAEIIDNFPGIFRLKSGDDDSKRKSDIQANEQRRELKAAMSNEDYIKSLKLKLIFDVNNKNQLSRITELSNKTNQFIFNYMRYSESEVEQRLLSPDYKTVTISLSDKLSDSGLIGVCVGKHEKGYVLIEECFISCRALGRGIDDVIVLGAIKEIAKLMKENNVQVLFQKGQRNEPALEFVNRFLAKQLIEPCEIDYIIPNELLTIEIHE